MENIINGIMIGLEIFAPFIAYIFIVLVIIFIVQNKDI